MLGFLTSRSFVSLCLLVAFACSASAQDWQEELKKNVSKAVSNQYSSYKHDHRSNITIGGRTVGKRGKEFTGHGKTGVATIDASKEGDGLNTKYVFDCEIPWEGHWVLKNWHGTGYNKEEKDASGKYKLKIKVHAFGGKIEFLEAKSLTDLNHDSRKMPVEALEADFLKNDEYLRERIFP